MSVASDRAPGHPSPFRLLLSDLAVGGPLPEGWRPITECKLLILVGLTGAGKTETIRALSDDYPECAVLPDRRMLTDELILPSVLAEHAELDPRNRLDRFALTRAYRLRFAGGMAHALTTLAVKSGPGNSPLIFDGLRGQNEVSWAARALPLARFLILQADNDVRVTRIAQRKDAFDSGASKTSPGDVGNGADLLECLGVPEAVPDFSPSTLMSWQAGLATGELVPADLAAAIRIVLEERKNYDPEQTTIALLTSAPDRTLVVDTTCHSPSEIARMAHAFGGWERIPACL